MISLFADSRAKQSINHGYILGISKKQAGVVNTRKTFNKKKINAKLHRVVSFILSSKKPKQTLPDFILRPMQLSLSFLNNKCYYNFFFFCFPVHYIRG